MKPFAITDLVFMPVLFKLFRKNKFLSFLNQNFCHLKYNFQYTFVCGFHLALFQTTSFAYA